MTEDFSTYTEVDPNSHITVVSAQVAVDDLGRDEDAYIYKDFGIGYFDGFRIDYAIRVRSVWALAHYVICFIGLANDVDDFANFDGIYTAVWNADASGPKTYDYLGDSPLTISDSTWYYCTAIREPLSNTVYIYIYSDSGRTNLISTQIRTGLGNVAYRYFYPIGAANTGAIGAADGDILNVTITRIPFSGAPMMW